MPVKPLRELVERVAFAPVYPLAAVKYELNTRTDSLPRMVKILERVDPPEIDIVAADGREE
jgi:hypothetical protein